MQSVSSRIWTRVAVSISYDDNHYTTGTSEMILAKLKTRDRGFKQLMIERKSKNLKSLSHVMGSILLTAWFQAAYLLAIAAKLKWVHHLAPKAHLIWEMPTGSGIFETVVHGFPTIQ